MKFVHYLSAIKGISVYPLISLFVFIVFFVGVTIYAFRTDKNTIDYLENLPLKD